MKYLLLILISLSTLSSFSQLLETKVGETETRIGPARMMKQMVDGDTTYLLTFFDEYTAKISAMRLKDTGFRRIRFYMDEVFSGKEYRVQITSANASVQFFDKSSILLSSPNGVLKLTRQQSKELFGEVMPNDDLRAVVSSTPPISAPKLQQLTVQRIRDTQVVVQRDTVYVAPPVSSTPHTREREPVYVSYYGNLKTIFATNKDIALAAGGLGSAGVAFESGLCLGAGGGAVYFPDTTFNYPLFGEIMFVGKAGSVAPYIALQAGFIIDGYEKLNERKSNQLYGSFSGGVSIPIGQKKTKITVYTGASYMNVDPDLNTIFWSSGVGFFF